MHAVNLIASALRSQAPPDAALPGNPAEAVCAVTGQIAPCYPRKGLLGSSFTNLDLLKAPDSAYISEDAWIALSCKWERMSSWICDGESFRRLERRDIRDLALGDAYPDKWAAYATTSYKKHGSLWAPVNTGRAAAVWRFEGIYVDCTDQDRLVDWWNIMDSAIRTGIGRQSMDTLLPSHTTLSVAGIAAWMDFYNWARSKYLSPLYRFLLYLMPSQEEIKNDKPD
jgi:hypothetical protein